MERLFVHAAALEGAAVGAELPACACIGVGKAAAAANLTRILLVAERPSVVVLFGVCGVYPGASEELAVGDLCLVEDDAFADEGVQTPAGFVDCSELGLEVAGRLEADSVRTREARARLGGIAVVRGATVSTCSGTDDLARARMLRSGATIETMEGAAVGLVCCQLGVPWIQLRAVSNRTGDRDRAGWNLGEAVARVQAAAMRLAREPW